jgi:pimeloyl-ACP methyl ester carboxylesterase
VPAIADAMLPKLLGPRALADPSGPAGLVRRLILGNPPAGTRDAIRCLMTRPDSTPTLAGITCPTLLIVGRDDQLTPVADHQAMHEALPGSRLHVIDEAGHLSNLERPDEFNRALFEFLESLLPAGHA